MEGDWETSASLQRRDRQHGAGGLCTWARGQGSAWFHLDGKVKEK